MSVRTKFDMYLAPPSRAVFAALGDWMAPEIADIEIAGTPAGDFLVGQVCGITLASAPAGRFHYLATPEMDDDAVPRGHYNSLIITPRESEIDRLAAFDTYISYAGTWTLEDDVFTTDVSFALNPGWVGGQQVRGVEIPTDDYLILSLSRAWSDGRVVSGWVKWKRANTRG